MKKPIYTLLILVFFSITILNLSAQGSRETTGDSSPAVTAGQKDTDNDGLPDNAEQLLGTNPYRSDTDGDSVSDADDEFPLSSAVRIQESSATPLSAEVLDSRVEDNYNAADHLEISLKNTGGRDIILQDAFITITDKASSARESYYVDLKKYSLKPGVKNTMHFDNGAGPGHFPGNINGLYRTAADGLIFDVFLHSNGFAPIKIQVEKAPGTAEIAD